MYLELKFYVNNLILIVNNNYCCRDNAPTIDKLIHKRVLEKPLRCSYYTLSSNDDCPHCTRSKSTSFSFFRLTIHGNPIYTLTVLSLSERSLSSLYKVYINFFFLSSCMEILYNYVLKIMLKLFIRTYPTLAIDAILTD